jgi:hypothetical protein
MAIWNSYISRLVAQLTVSKKRILVHSQHLTIKMEMTNLRKWGEI